MRVFGLLVGLSLVAACSDTPPPAQTAPSSRVAAIPPAPDQPVSKLERIGKPVSGDLDGVIERGYLRILVAPSRTHFQTVDGHHRGRAVDVGVALARTLSADAARDVVPVFIERSEDQLVASLRAGRGDVAANLLLTFERDEQVAFAPPVKSDVRELVITDANPLVSLEDVGGRVIHVRKSSDHHASLIRLNEQLKKNNRRPAVIAFDEKARTDEDLLDSVNAGRIRATIVDDYVFDFWKKNLPKVASTNRDVAVSQDGVIAWATRKDAPALTAALKEFFSTHKLTF
jgi:membrane-bound lytic murein transglycosylase MltF